jgi:hypothetical protein
MDPTSDERPPPRERPRASTKEEASSIFLKPPATARQPRSMGGLLVRAEFGWLFASALMPG